MDEYFTCLACGFMVYSFREIIPFQNENTKGILEEIKSIYGDDIEVFNSMITIKDGNKYKIIEINRTSNVCGTNSYGAKYGFHNLKPAKKKRYFYNIYFTSVDDDIKGEYKWTSQEFMTLSKIFKKHKAYTTLPITDEDIKIRTIPNFHNTYMRCKWKNKYIHLSEELSN